MKGVNGQEDIGNTGCRSEDCQEGCRGPSFSTGRSNDPETGESFRPNNPEAGRTVAQNGSSHLVLPEHSAQMMTVKLSAQQAELMRIH